VRRSAPNFALSALLAGVRPGVRPEEIACSREQMVRTSAAITDARLRLDSIRLIVEGPQALG